jgi:flagellin-like protein
MKARNKASKKGVSPIIATVLLIGFTMVIAGMMAAWSNAFSTKNLDEATSTAECIGSMDISSLSFNNGTVVVKIRNLSGYLNLTGIHASVEYGDATKNRDYSIIDYNATDPLTPAMSTFFIVNTGETTKPSKIVVVAKNCPKESAVLTFR